MSVPEQVDRRTAYPGLRCIMGKWVYYVTSMTFRDVAAWVERSDEIYESAKLQDLVQREIGKRVGGIVEYLQAQEDERFFSSIILGLYEGKPKWYPIEIGQSMMGLAPTPSSDAFDNVGVLVLEGAERVFAIDGQHRVEAIKKAIKKNPDLAEEDLAVVFVGHGTTKERKERTRRLFSTVNKHAKPVTPGEIVALDEDDTFAIVTRRLVEEFELLRSGFKDDTGYVLITGSRGLPRQDQTHLTTILALYSIAETLHVPLGTDGRQKKVKSLKFKRPTDSVLEEVYEGQVAYWKELRNTVSAYKELFAAKPETEIAGRLRNDELELMLRPVAQIGFARAVSVLMGRGQTMTKAVRTLAKIPMRLDEAPWKGTLWDPGQKKMKRSPGYPFIEAIMLHLVGAKGRGKNASPAALLAKYRELLDDASAKLPAKVV